MIEDQNPQNNRLPEDLRPENDRLSADAIAQLKSAQTLVTVSTISAPVSLLIGGVLLSTVALVCGWFAFKKLKAIRPRNAAESQAIAQVHKSCKMGMIMSGIAFGLNAISAAMMYPMYMEALQSGNFPNMSDLAGGGVNSGSTTPGPSSVWG